MPRVGGAPIAALVTGAKALLAHEPRDPLATHAMATLAQFHLHPRTAIAASIAGINRGHYCCQHLILSRPRRGRTRTPRIEARP